MTLKRKANELDEHSASPEPRVPSLSSSQGSMSSSYHASPEDGPLNLWNIAGAPYFNSRTRKRFRDGRPAEDTIHEQTLKKLFDAQRRQHHADEETNYTNSCPSMGHIVTPMDQRHPRMPVNTQYISGPVNRVEIPPERNQRSIESFFSHPSTNSYEDAHPTLAVQPPLPAPLYQPSEQVPHLIPPHPPSLPSILTCEDCYAPLLTKNSHEAIDAEMCDVDGPVLDPELDSDGWTCVLCAKRVCDVCAVRGDYRVCLECAVPGGGKYRPEELREKRWVGGIGWM